MKEEVNVVEVVASSRENATNLEKRPYTPPKLTVFGDVEDLTRAAGNLGSDGVFTSRTAA